MARGSQRRSASTTLEIVQSVPSTPTPLTILSYGPHARTARTHARAHAGLSETTLTSRFSSIILDDCQGSSLFGQNDPSDADLARNMWDDESDSVFVRHHASPSTHHTLF